MKQHFPHALLLVISLLLSGCFLPEKFSATLVVDKTGGFKLTYDGTMAYSPALGEIKQRGALSAKDEEEMAKGVDALKKEPGCKSAEYIGNGRFKVLIEQNGKISDQTTTFFDLITFRVSPNGEISIYGANLEAKAASELKAVGFKIDGTLTIDSAIPVVSQNASSTPSLGGLIGHYSWTVDLDQKERPKMVLKP